jgi:uncharacterized protein YcbX
MDPQSASAPGGRVVGRVAALWRYPVKAMGGEQLDEAAVAWYGLAGDRRWAFVRDGQARNGFPWLTIRERPELVGYRPSLNDPDRANASPVTVRTPSGDLLDVADPALATELGDGVRVMKLDRGAFDSMPLSLISAQAVAGIGALLGRATDVRRFRPNVLVDAADASAFPEDGWVGSVLRIGGARIRLDRRDSRCKVTTVDPATAARDPEVLRVIARERDGFLGVYGSAVEPGNVAVGDPVIVEP